MSQKLPEAKQLFDSLSRISQKEFETRFGQLLKSNPSYDTEQVEDSISKEAPNTKESIGDKFKDLPRLTQKLKKEYRDKYKQIFQEINTKLIDNDEFGYVNYLAEKYPTFEKYKEKSNLGGNQDLQLLAKGFYKPPQKVSMDEFYQLASDQDAVIYFRGIKSQWDIEKSGGVDEAGAIIKHYDYTTADIQYNTFNDQIPYYMGGGQNGDGIYVTTNVMEAFNYTEGGVNSDVLRFTAKKSDLNVIKKHQLNELSVEVEYYVSEKIKELSPELSRKQMILDGSLELLTPEEMKLYKSGQLVEKFTKEKEQQEKKLYGLYAMRRVIAETDSSALAVMLGFDAVAVNRTNEDYPGEHLVILNYGKFKSFDNEEIRKEQPPKYWKYDYNRNGQERKNEFFTTKNDTNIY